MAQPKYEYAQLPVFKYQTFDRESLQFSDVPIIPPTAKPPVVGDDDADEPLKEGDPPTDAPVEAEVQDVPVSDSIEKPATGMYRGICPPAIYSTRWKD